MGLQVCSWNSGNWNFMNQRIYYTKPSITELEIEYVNDAIRNPSKNIQNIYFGLIMGISAMIPTIVHFIMFLKSLFNVLAAKK